MRQAEPLARPISRAWRSSAGEIRMVEANTVILPEGARGNAIHVLLDGWAARFKILENGSRQVPALRLRDICDLDALYLERRTAARRR
jgi:CRP-like cAMP-binding protein